MHNVRFQQFPILIASFLMLLSSLFTGVMSPTPALAQSTVINDSNPQAVDDEHGAALPNVAVLPFWTFDDSGRPVPVTSQADLARLAGVLPQAIAARLIQSEQYTVIDLPFLEAYDVYPTDEDAELARVEALLAQDYVDQVITGTVAQVERGVVISIRRYVPTPKGAELDGAAVAQAASASAAVEQVDNLLTHAFPLSSDVVRRPISRVIAVPNAVRIPVGGRAQINAYALDEFGRAMPTVSILYQVDDESRATVDSRGMVQGLKPGRTTLSLQPMGRPMPSGKTPEVDVHVIGPSLGLRAGTSFVPGEGVHPRIGLRLIPSVEVRQPSRLPTDSIDVDTNPTNFLTSFFASLLGNGLLTLDLDVDPSHSIGLTLDAVQRSIGGFFGTGIGVSVPLSEKGPSGVHVRLTFGTQIAANADRTVGYPIELNADFHLGSGDDTPAVMLGISAGLDLFQ